MAKRLRIRILNVSNLRENRSQTRKIASWEEGGAEAGRIFMEHYFCHNESCLYMSFM